MKALCVGSLLLLCVCTARSGGPPPSDVVIDSLLNGAVQQIVSGIAKTDAATLHVSSHPDVQYVEASMLEALHAIGVSILTIDAPTSIEVVIKDMATRYTVLSGDSVEREVIVSLSATVKRDGTVTPLNTSAFRRVDACLRKEAILAESLQHASTHGNMPEAERTFWDDVLEPAIFVAAAATTVILLFTVRSK